MELLRNLYQHQPCTIVDVGARNGLSLLKSLHPFAAVFAIEPELQAAEKLKKSSPGTFRAFSVHEMALAAQSGEATLHVTRTGSMSSLLQPDYEEFRRGFGGAKSAEEWLHGLDIVHEQKVKTETLSNFFTQHALGFIDFLKIDTQGNELDILKGGEELLRGGRIGVICTEVALHPIYRNQSYFSDVDVFLRDCGYRLVEFRTYPDEVLKQDEFSFGNSLHERPKLAPVGDAWYVCEMNEYDRLQTVGGLRVAAVLACEGYFSEASYYLGDKLSENDRTALFRFLSHQSGQEKMKHLLKRWTPLAVQQWRSKHNRK